MSCSCATVQTFVFSECVRYFPSYQKQASMHDFCGRVTDDERLGSCACHMAWGTNHLDHVIFPGNKSHYLYTYAVFKFSAKVD